MMREPAFPTHEWDGMDIRDYFAAQALPIAAQMVGDPGEVLTMGEARLFATNTAHHAYVIADAMLKERAK